MTYSAAGLPAGLSIDASSGLISGSVASTADADSPYTVTVTAATATASASQTFTWTVSPPIIVDRFADQTSAAGDAVSVAVSASDADGDPLSYSAIGLPAGLAIDAASGVITGTLAAGADTSSPSLGFVVASDGSRSASTSFVWTVSHVGLARPSDPTSADGQTVSLAIL